MSPRRATSLWLGAAAGREQRAPVLGRSLGGRDIALAAGALAALTMGHQDEARHWVRAGALADATDAIGTLACWSSLPRANRIVTVAASATAALLGLAATR